MSKNEIDADLEYQRIASDEWPKLKDKKMRNIERIIKPNKNEVAEQSATAKVKKECIETIKSGNQQSIIYYKGFGSCIFKVPRAEPEVRSTGHSSITL